MPASIRHNCPHCDTQRIAFTLAAETKLAAPRANDWLTLFKCAKCQGGLVIEYQYQVNHGVTSPGACNGDPSNLGFHEYKFYPGKMPPSSPSHTPEPMLRFFKQAVEALHSGSPDAAGAMSRKVLDVSTQTLLRELIGEDAKKFGTIQKAIDELAARNVLTPALREWAHVVRLEGNVAAHDADPYTQEEADELLSFVDLYLTYVYTMPARLELRRKKAAEEKKKKAEAK
jgi:hypothetical protein